MLRFDTCVNRCGTTFSYFFEKCVNIYSQKRGTYDFNCFQIDYVNQYFKVRNFHGTKFAIFWQLRKSLKPRNI